ncbi:MAG: DUF6391 domain-containing protein [Anaerolineae bacterium]
MLSQLISRVRRNHGLEHATIHVLSEKHKNFSAQGNSDHRGFHLNIYGNIAESDVVAAVNEACARMKAGEHQLAVHPNCGTVLLTTATMATLAAQATFGLEQYRHRRNRLDGPAWVSALPSAILAVIVALIVSRPLGVRLQAKYTTEGDLGRLRVVRIRKVDHSPITRLFQLLLTGGNSQLKAAAYRVETEG